MKKIALCILLSSAVPAFAGDVYVVGSIGRSVVKINKSQADLLLTAAGATGLSSTADETAVGYKAQVGYQFNKYFALEGGYVDLGKVDYSANFTNFGGGNIKIDYKASGFNFAALGIVPINDSFSLFGKLGVLDAKVETNGSARVGAFSYSASQNSTKWKSNIGFGGTFHVNKNLGFRIEYEEFSKVGNPNTTGQADVRMLSTGVVYKF